MRSAEFEEHALALVARGYNPLVIAPRCQPRPDGRKVPEGKAPGVRFGGEWRLAFGWEKWCTEQVSEHTVRAWARMISTAEDAGIGVALGRGLICIDIDLEEAVESLLAILPPSPVQKKGRKGISLFYRGDTEKIRSKNFRTPERAGLVDLLAEGKQTVLPPSIHPDTGEPYYWWTDYTLADFRVEDLPELSDDIAERIGEVLKPFGYDPEAERPATLATTQARNTAPVSGGRSIYRQANDDALANLDCWVPDLHLYKARRKPGGFEAVAHWRSSSTGRALEFRKRNLSIVRKGIEDFGTGEKYTPIDLVMRARDCDKSAALNWLLERLPDDEPKIVLVNGPKTLERLRARDHQNL
ncbi:bifunctional DNA primase/polymerase [Nitrobacter sp. JJSN]|uniref:bifunctional DNA primase/polymerase n=1 Tax=Nitrobacter sp. JJSN TaxID=3453033 RepID=UPI003F75C7D1